MNALRHLKRRFGVDSTEDELLYLQVVKELERGFKREGLWAKALAESEGDPDKAQAKYIRLRVLSIRDESSVKNKEKRSPQWYEDKIAKFGLVVFISFFAFLIIKMVRSQPTVDELREESNAESIRLLKEAAEQARRRQ